MSNALVRFAFSQENLEREYAFAKSSIFENIENIDGGRHQAPPECALEVTEATWISEAATAQLLIGHSSRRSNSKQDSCFSIILKIFLILSAFSIIDAMWLSGHGINNRERQQMKSPLKIWLRK